MKLVADREMSIGAPSLVHSTALFTAAHVNFDTLPGLVISEMNRRFDVDGIYSLDGGNFGIERGSKRGSDTKALFAVPSKTVDGFGNCPKLYDRTSVVCKCVHSSIVARMGRHEINRR